MNTNALLDLLEKDARLSARDLADMLDEEEGTVRKGDEIEIIKDSV